MRPERVPHPPRQPRPLAQMRAVPHAGEVEMETGIFDGRLRSSLPRRAPPTLPVPPPPAGVACRNAVRVLSVAVVLPLRARGSERDGEARDQALEDLPCPGSSEGATSTGNGGNLRRQLDTCSFSQPGRAD